MLSVKFDFIELYWAFIGNPISKIVGYLSDLTSLSITEVLLNYSLICCIYILYVIVFKKQKKYLKTALVGVLLLIIMTFSQGITKIDFVPTVFRSHPLQRLENIKINESDCIKFVAISCNAFLKDFNSKHYMSLPQEYELESANKIVNDALAFMKYPIGREVKKIKNMMGLTRLLGLSYGGPAFHDVVSGEVVIASIEDLPSSKYWRRMCLIHEIVHAQGFTRELDAEILTWLALRLSDFELDRQFSMLMVISKSRTKIEWPEVLQTEAKLNKEKQIEVDRNSPFLTFLKKASKEMSIQNNSEKYGTIHKGSFFSKSEFLLCTTKIEHLLEKKAALKNL